jgi:predicted glycosyltransferase
MRTLIAPLNWGLGHATRCIPLIQKLLSEGQEIIIAADGHPLKLLKTEFPDLSYIELPSYKISYNRGKSQLTAMIRSIPVILWGIIREHHQLKRIIREHQIDRVISDNRFGLWNRHIHSTYITHQLMIKMPKGLMFATPLVWLGHRLFINKFDVCMIPDYEGEQNLSGDLSHKYPLPRNAQFIGPLSRFAGLSANDILNTPLKFDVVAIISGPEPQRTLLEEQVIKRFKNAEKKVLVLQGLPANQTSDIIPQTQNNLVVLPHLETRQIAIALTNTRKIICRSGYSTIMDLQALNCLSKAELIPTPGQTEQEYLAQYHKKRELSKQLSALTKQI